MGPVTWTTLLVTVSGQDRPGIAAALFGALDRLDVSVLDVEQVRVHGGLLLSVESRVGPSPTGAPDVEEVRRGIEAALERLVGSGDTLRVSVRAVDADERIDTVPRDARHLVTVRGVGFRFEP